MTETFGERLYRLRTNKLFSQRGLAERVGVEHRVIIRFERGDCKPRADTLVSLAQVLNVTTDYLLTGNDPDVALRAAVLAGASRPELIALALMEPPDGKKPGSRKCLRCQREFHSHSSGNRLCEMCHRAGNDQWRSGAKR